MPRILSERDGLKTRAPRSMTGYGVAEAVLNGQRVRVHLKSVNHRFVEIRTRLPKSWAEFEIEMRSVVQRNLTRGSADLWVEDGDAAAAEEHSRSAEDLMEQLARAVRATRQRGARWALPAPLRALVLMRYPDVWLRQTRAAKAEISKDLAVRLTEEAYAQLELSREKEGRLIVDTVSGERAEMEKARREIERELPGLRAEWEQQYQLRVAKAAESLKISEVPAEKIAHELLLLAERRDVAEEVQRLGGHLDALGELLSNPADNLGKRLEFFVQELHREWTTLGNKIQNASTGRRIIDAKLAVEKIREQSLNLV